MRLFVTGATGLVGRRLVLDRLLRGDQVVVLSRRGEEARRLFATEANPNVTVVEADPTVPGPWQRSVDGCDAVVHLAGAPVAARRWTAAYRRVLVDSRLDSTHQVARAIQEADHPPTALISASGGAVYGDTGDRPVDETSPPGSGGFLTDLASRWEAQATRAASEWTRVVLLRTGVVLDSRGGMLGKLLPLFRLGLGGPWGSGRQYVPWVHWRDMVAMIGLLLSNPDAEGPFNAAAPNPVTVREFARVLGRVLGRPALLPAPTLLLRVAVGRMSEVLVESSRMVPARIQAAGLHFHFPELEPALRSILEPPDDGHPDDASTPSPVEDAPSSGDAGATAGTPGLVMPPAPVRLIALAVDGTLLRSDGRLPQGVVRACRAAEEAGCVVVLATARPPRATRSILQALHVTAPVINYNGAVIWNPRDDREQFHQPLASELAGEIIETVRGAAPEIMLGIESLDHWFTDRLDPQVQPATPPDEILPLPALLDRPITVLELGGQPETMGRVVDLLRERFWRSQRIALFVTSRRSVQVTDPLVDKSIALQRIAARLGLPREQVMAVGDGENDQGMLEWAGFGVAVANACDSARSLAAQVVPSNDEVGVARAIRRYVLEPRGL
jgi:uncharacterized protein (TIGR01777 family)